MRRPMNGVSLAGLNTTVLPPSSAPVAMFGNDCHPSQMSAANAPHQIRQRVDAFTRGRR